MKIQLSCFYEEEMQICSSRKMKLITKKECLGNIGAPQILDGMSRFCPPRMIVRNEPYCLFLYKLNACSQKVQKAFTVSFLYQ